MTALLETKNLSMRFGGLTAVSNLNLQVEAGRITALIGPNGAGKTTVFNMLTGVYSPTVGDIVFDGQSLAGRKSFQIARLGLARTFQNIRLFKNLSVIDNVKIGCDMTQKRGVWQTFAQTPGFCAQEQNSHKNVLQWLDVFHLQGRALELAKNLPYGDQRRVEMARALATGAKLLLLDEPAAGLNNQETQELMGIIQNLRDQFGVTILLIEHDMKLVMGISQKIFVLDYGVLIAEGVPEEVRRNPAVIEAYLGKNQNVLQNGVQP